MHVTYSKKSMEVWLSHHEPIIPEPDIGDYEYFLLEQLAAKPSISHKAMCTAMCNARGMTCKEAPIRSWLAAHKGALPMPIAEAASSSSAPPMPVLQLADIKQYGDFLRKQLSEAPDITVALLREKLI